MDKILSEKIGISDVKLDYLNRKVLEILLGEKSYTSDILLEIDNLELESIEKLYILNSLNRLGCK